MTTCVVDIWGNGGQKDSPDEQCGVTAASKLPVQRVMTIPSVESSTVVKQTHQRLDEWNGCMICLNGQCVKTDFQIAAIELCHVKRCSRQHRWQQQVQNSAASQRMDGTTKTKTKNLINRYVQFVGSVAIVKVSCLIHVV